MPGWTGGYLRGIANLYDKSVAVIDYSINHFQRGIAFIIKLSISNLSS